MPGQFPYDRASRALAIASIEGDATATETENITARTLQRYRARLTKDDTLSRLVADKRAVLEREWAHKIAPTLRAALDFIQRATHALDPADPEAVHAMAGAMKLVNEAGLAGRVIDARLALASGPTHRPPRTLPTTTNGTHTTTN